MYVNAILFMLLCFRCPKVSYLCLVESKTEEERQKSKRKKQRKRKDREKEKMLLIYLILSYQSI